MSKKEVRYEDFVEKFKPKKTTDDCYTPDGVYSVVADWVKEKFGIQEEQIVRPFYPGGDYENFNYAGDSVVVDNPPFSIFSKIVRFYMARGIRFFLFAPSMTGIRKECTYIGTGNKVTYENGAIVGTSFVTNMMGDVLATSEPELYMAVQKAADAYAKRDKIKRQVLEYPPCVLRASFLYTMSRANVRFSVKQSEGVVVDKVNGNDFGNSILLNDVRAGECKAMRMAAEAVMRRKKAEAIPIELSERSKELLKALNTANTANMND